MIPPRFRGALINVAVFLLLAGPVFSETMKAVETYRRTGAPDLLDLAFLANNLTLLALVLLRSDHEAVHGNVFHQAVALAAVVTGFLFVDAPNGSPALLSLARALILAAMLLGLVTLVNLGGSFGFLIAKRKVKRGGLYAVVRHPMYATDILWKTGMLIKKPCPVNAGVFLLCVACYVYRALLEERFLATFPDYRDYMERVRFRFLPGVF